MDKKKGFLLTTISVSLVMGFAVTVSQNKYGVLSSIANVSYSCGLPDGFHELADAIAISGSEKTNPYSLRGTITRSVDGVSYIQRVNQTNQELDSIKLINSASYTAGNVIDIVGGTLKTVDNVPCLDATGATITVRFNENPTGYEPIRYSTIATFVNDAFSRDTYNYSHFVEIDYVTVAFVGDQNNVFTLFDANNEGARMNIVAGNNNIVNLLNDYHYQDSVINIKGILERYNGDDLLKVVSVDDVILSSSPLRNPQNTTIFHAFNWSMTNITNQLETIKNNGFKTIQISPMQPQKDYYYGGDWKNEWWKLYQPLGFSIAQSGQNTLGTESELTELCSRAKSMGIGIIVDVIANHLGGGTGESFDSGVNYYEPDIYDGGKTTYIHTGVGSPDDDNTRSIVQGHLGSYPDVKTETSLVQNRVINLLKSYIDCGVTGFRFDAAKHIETPTDYEYSSNFWSNVLGTVTSYGQTKGINPYYYGEVLSPGYHRNWNMYTSMMSVTDSYTGQLVREAVTNKNYNSLNSDYHIDASGDKAVVWAESHDTYSNDTTSGISQDKIHKTYAILASRSSAATLYLARPNNNAKMRDYSTAYNTAVVRASNIFHNELVGSSEYIKKTDGCFINVRKGEERAGAVIVNIDDGSHSTIDLNVDTNYMIPDGEYTELISNTKVTVSSGRVNSHFSSEGVMVLLRDTKAKYGLMIGSTPLYASKTGEFDGFTQYVVNAHKFRKGEVFSLYDFENKASWAVNIDGWSFGSPNGDGSNISKYLVKNASSYTVQKDFTATIYIKMSYGNDQIYFGLTEMSVSESSVTAEIGEDVNVIINNAVGNITATSNNTNVATVTKEGTTLVIRGVAKGETTISVSDGETNKNISVRVKAHNELNISLKDWVTGDDGENFYAYFWGDNVDGYFVKINPDANTNASITYVDGVTKVILLRKENNKADWSGEWNRTGDLTIQDGTLTFVRWHIDNDGNKPSEFAWL